MRKRPDVWEDLGDTHVILALTPEECRVAIDFIQHGLHDSWREQDGETAHRAQLEITRSLRDQRGGTDEST